ncbi:hypothetical protein, partial [Micrococcus luteus]|uniref:hypothetical protein n=1 Tax=Micrococcus luteus TaxID=1270 RepID=UPI001C92BE80
MEGMVRERIRVGWWEEGEGEGVRVGVVGRMGGRRGEVGGWVVREGWVWGVEGLGGGDVGGGVEERVVVGVE